MPDLTVHGVPQGELDAIDARAQRHGRSSEDELRHLIHEAAAEEHLLQQLEQAQRATERLRTAERKSELTSPSSTTPVAATPARRRYKVAEPTPRKR